MKKKKFRWLKILLIVIGVIVLLAIGISVVVKNVTKNINAISESEMGSFFTDYEVKEEDMVSYVKGTGELTSFNIKTVEIPSYGKIKNTYVKDGNTVKKKQKLFKVSVDGTKKTIKAPIAGMYFEVENNGEKVRQIYSLTNMGIEMYVSENDVALLKNGQKAYIKITALNREVEGTVSYISKLPYDGRFKVRIKVKYENDIRFGYGASVRIVVSEKANALIIPYNALQMDDDNKYYVIKEEYKKDFFKYNMYGGELPEEAKTYVEVGTITNNQVEILSGLQAGDIVEEWIW